MKIASFLLRSMFLGFFAFQAYFHLANPAARGKELSTRYTNLEGQLKKNYSKSIPEPFTAKNFAKYSADIGTYLTYAQLGLSVVSLIFPIFTPLLGFIHLLETFLIHNGLKFVLETLGYPDYEPFFIAIALFAGSFMFCCKSCTKKCDKKPEKLSEREIQKKEKRTH